MKGFPFAGLMLLVLTACTATVLGPSNKDELVTNPFLTAIPVILPAAKPWGLVEEEITVQAADDLLLTGTFYAPAGPPPWHVIILLHMIYGNSQDWEEFPEQLTQAGYAVLNLDMRGHGKTGGSIDWNRSKDDLQRVWNYLAERPEVEIACGAIIGASMGANVALELAAENPEICAVGLLSPGLDYYRVTTADKISTFGARPMLIIASDEDTYAANSSRRLEEMAQSEAKLVIYSQAGHGTAMLRKEPLLSKLIIEWLDSSLTP